ncbi:MAG: tRNA 2-thiouridine(34) synthase MnmA [Chloroflexota bacterium]
MPQKCVAVAMSGGVDSSVAAAILKEECYQVIGITMLLYSEYGNKEAENARQVAKNIGIPHHIVDFRRLFEKRVIIPFCNEYQQGRTPNPCINCNSYVKFDTLLKKAIKLGADFIATGHYARVEASTDDYRLLKGVDHSKDQSYFLYTLGQKQLQRLLLPLGTLYKNQTKRMARELGLADITKPESQDICFIPDSDYSSFIGKRISSPPGDIIDTDGRIIGRHKGLAHYTVGQRQGLGLSSNKRLYVIRLDTGNNRLVAGSQEHLFTSNLSANRLSWVSGKAPDETANITAKIRYRSPEVKVNLDINKDTAEVRFAQPQWAVTPGQSTVFYQGEVVLGGGVIETPKLIEGNEADKHPIHAILR